VFGYLLLDDWIKDCVAKKGLGLPDLDILNMTSAVGVYVMREGRIGGLAVVKWGEEDVLCYGLAHDKTPEGLKLITRDRIDMVKRAMKKDEEPPWYTMA
jgi:hypothetical protein